MSEDVRYTHPLMGVVICCTSINSELRSELANMAIAMGAMHRCDLTSDVTHLIVGDIDTPKYKYVAKNRLDVKVVDAKWVDAMHKKWIAGEDINIREYEEKHRFPTLLGLIVCVTNIPDNERPRVQTLIEENGAIYHPDLTRQVTHLIAAVPEGRKYEFARQWNLKVVSPEWLYHSLTRGMVLDESCYDPTLPKKRIGVGAQPEMSMMNSRGMGPSKDAIAGVASGSGSAEEISQIGRRRMREDMTRKIEGQSQSLWADIIGQAGSSKAKKRDEWDEDREAEAHNSRKIKPSRARRTIEDDDEINGNAESRATGQGTTTATVRTLRQKEEGLFANRLFYTFGFNRSKEKVLEGAITSHSGIVQPFSELPNIQKDYPDIRQCFIIVPEECSISSHLNLDTVSGLGINTLIVSFWWLERCLHEKDFFVPKHPNIGGEDIDILCFPFTTTPLRGFESMEITITGFTGIHLTHMSKLIPLTGAKYVDTLTANRTTVLISAMNDVKTDKAQAAISWNIPVVSVKWISECLQNGKRLDFDDFLIDGIGKRPQTEEHGQRKRHRKSTSNQNRVVAGRVDRQESSKALTDKTVDKILTTKKPKSDRVDAISETVLESSIVCVSEQLQHRVNELEAIARSLGAKVVRSFNDTDPELLTHYIHLKTTPTISPQLRLAGKIPNCHIVSPEWLYECKSKIIKVKEDAFTISIPDTSEGQAPGRQTEMSNISKAKVPDNQVVAASGQSKARRVPFEIDDSEEEDHESIEAREEAEFHPPTHRQMSTKKDISSPGESISITNLTAKPAINQILRFGLDKLTSALEKPKRHRKLQGRATSNISAYHDLSAPREASFNNSSAENRKSASLDPQSASALSLKRGESMESSNISGRNSEVEGGFYLTQFTPQSQSVSYADPEAQIERKRMIDKLNGLEPTETPGKPVKEPKTAVVQDVYGTKRKTRSNH